MSDLVEFLLARIADEEREAKDVGIDARRQWATYANDVAGRHHGAGMLVLRHNPARVLAECEAKRRIVTDRGFLDIHGILSIFGARILGYMAEPYRDHPDYDEAWRP